MKINLCRCQFILMLFSSDHYRLEFTSTGCSCFLLSQSIRSFHGGMLSSASSYHCWLSWHSGGNGWSAPIAGFFTEELKGLILPLESYGLSHGWPCAWLGWNTSVRLCVRASSTPVKCVSKVRLRSAKKCVYNGWNASMHPPRQVKCKLINTRIRFSHSALVVINYVITT